MVNEWIGAGSIQQLAGILKNLSSKKVYIVSGKKSYELSGAKEKLENLLKGINYYRYCNFEENPKFKDLVKGAKLIRNYNPDLVIAIGGGSVIDTAKIISVLPVDVNLGEAMVRGNQQVTGKIAPLTVIPTTAGSGSEATHFAVVYLDKEKYSVAHERLLPDYVIIDPVFTYSMSPYQTAVSGMDALCQAIESYWAKGATEESRMFASEAISCLLKSLESAVNHPDPAVRMEMAKGANLSGKAINTSKTTAPHALSYGFTSYYGIPHGHAVALTIGEFIVLNTVKASEASDGELSIRMNKLFELLGCENAESARVKFRQIMKNIGLEPKLGEIVTNEKNINIHHLVNNVNTERLQNHPVKVSKGDISRIITRIL